jgi:hypothetical protein
MCSKRPMVRPNLGFWRQLIHYEQVRLWAFSLIFFKKKIVYVTSSKDYFPNPETSQRQ